MFFTRNSGYDESIEGDAVLKKYMSEFQKARDSKVNARGVTPMAPGGCEALAGRVLVVGGRDDVIVDEVALQETAEYWGQLPEQQKLVVLDRCPHDMMLASQWREAADCVISWILEDGYLPTASRRSSQ
jgi:pimeloyl-ACP methyl ester carboxylesterase